MLVLGIDPGIATTGYGFVKTNPAGNPELVAYGVLSTSATSSTSMRLTSLYDQVRELIRQYQPDACALEKLFFQKNIKTAMTVSEARGVISLCISQAGFEPAEYTPSEVKQAVTSNGNAPKSQVQEMVKFILEMDEIPKPDDAADALAIAICHLSHARYKRLIDEQG
ncbi:MAG TPA: crossover junction endodeoxyribonuclease RuvC [Anaerolineaceae bacterium]|nr:crossover junction endodeoxyribonuclease RuvC [Anaerolineaceae bacterium]HNZ14607.1 crossover junction endodeoxyribonuclease RuvC [Anaerolineaceae bacterium]HOH92275.1 crossover junction endodeoxyribonuclease RuvC [Anaerolineaceae bacterium]HQN69202.1 crossover junction endodeoxyribonuclease RuvC [Anaerolineaceae bacterium]